MSTNIKRKAYPKIDAIIKRVNNRNRKQSATVYEQDSLTPNGTYWDGGSIAGYVCASIAGFSYHPISAPTAPSQFGGGDAKEFTITDDVIVIRFGVLQGRTLSPSIYGTKAGLAKLGFTKETFEIN